jgi:hypothetical protein
MKPRREMDKVGMRKNMMKQMNDHNPDSQGLLPTGAPGESYEIHMKGHLDDSWSDWLEGMDVRLLENGEMILYGRIVDQAALMGILTKLYGLNLTLISVNKQDGVLTPGREVSQQK